MTRLYQTVIWLVIPAINLGIVESAMCDDGWVYYSHTSTCLMVQKNISHLFRLHDQNPCKQIMWGEYGNISGDIVEFSNSIEPFLRDYLQFINISAAVVKLSWSWIRHHVLINGFDISRSFSNKTLLTYFMPGNTVPFTKYSRQMDAFICQVKAAPIEPPLCPRDVRLVSVSDRDAILSWSPGQLGRKVSVIIEVQICDGVPLSCDYFTKRYSSDVSRFQSMNYTVTGLRPNTKYKLVLQIYNDKYQPGDCNVTLALETNEERYQVAVPVAVTRTDQEQELSGAVIGLSIMLSISLCVCAVLAVFQCRHYRHNNSKQDEDRVIDMIVAKAMTPKSKLEVVKPNSGSEVKSEVMKPESSPGIKLGVHKNQGPNRCPFGNFQEQQHNYDKTIVTDDDHIYEI